MEQLGVTPTEPENVPEAVTFTMFVLPVIAPDVNDIALRAGERASEREDVVVPPDPPVLTPT